MKVLLVNGSPHKNGSTNRALQEVEKTLQASGVETEIFWIGNEPIGGCIGCGGCGKTGACVFGGVVAEFTGKAKEADGFVFGSPVHYAAASGNMTSFLDRVFYSADAETFRFKPAAVVTAARRGGLRAVTQVPWHFAHADRLEPVLEHGARCKRAGRGAGFRGSSDHARAGPQYGVAPFVHRGRKGRGHQSARRRALPAHKFHSLNSVCFIPAGSRLPVYFSL